MSLHGLERGADAGTFAAGVAAVDGPGLASRVSSAREEESASGARRFNSTDTVEEPLGLCRRCGKGVSWDAGGGGGNRTQYGERAGLLLRGRSG